MILKQNPKKATLLKLGPEILRKGIPLTKIIPTKIGKIKNEITDNHGFFNDEMSDPAMD